MVYLDNSATTFPKPDKVYEKMDTLYREAGASPGRGGYNLERKASLIVERARASLADFLGSSRPENVVFTMNATDALNMAFQGVLKEGDEVITTVLEHNSVSRPLNVLAKKKKIKITRLEPENGKIKVEDIKKALSRKTKMVAITHASNVTGWIEPIFEIGRMIRDHSNAYFLVDAAQTAGLLPIKVEEMAIDLLAFTGHKALYGPSGIGGLFVSERVFIEPFRAGGSGRDSENEFYPEKLPEKLEAGTQNLLGIIGLEAGLDFIRQTGMENIRRKEEELKQSLLEELRRHDKIKLYGDSDSSEGLAIICFNIENLSPEESASILDSEFDIAVRAGLHCAPYLHKLLRTFPQGAVRVSPGFFNTQDEIKALIEAVRIILKKI
jgi:cysteine desulfurase family protein